MSRRRNVTPLKTWKDKLEFLLFVIWGMGLIFFPFLSPVFISEGKTLGFVMPVLWVLFVTVPIIIAKKNRKKRLLMEEEDKRLHVTRFEVCCGKFGTLTFSRDDRQQICILESESPELFPGCGRYGLVYQGADVMGSRVSEVLERAVRGFDRINGSAHEAIAKRYDDNESFSRFEPKLLTVPHSDKADAELEGECSDGCTAVWIIVTMKAGSGEYRAILEEDEYDDEDDEDD